MTDVVDLALAYYRGPLDYPDRRALATPLPAGMERLLWLANASPEAIAAETRRTGARAEELRDAARFCIQQWCLARNADPYRVLGVQPGAALEQIKEHHRLLMRLFHPDRAGGGDETWTDQYASRINEAWTAVSRSHGAMAADGPSSSKPAPVQERVCLTTECAVTHAVSPPPSPPRSQQRLRVRRRRLLRLLAWGGSVLVLGATVSGVWLDRFSLGLDPVPRASVGNVDPSASVATIQDPPAAAPAMDPGPFSPFLVAPDWQALAQREQQAQQHATQLHEQQLQLEQSRQHQMVTEETLLASMREERTKLEEEIKAEQLRMQQLQSERLAAEQRRLQQLQAEQARVEQAQTEREQQVRRRLEELQAERLKAERLAEETRQERNRLEKTRSVPVPTEQQRSEADEPPAKPAQPTVNSAPVTPKLAVMAAAPETLTVSQVENLMRRYIEAYQRGDLNSVMALFAAGARGRIQGDYAALFAKYSVRGLWLRDLRWDYRGLVANGTGRYELKLRQRDGGEFHQVEGSIRFTVQQRDKQILIEAIEYDWPKQ